MAAELLHTLRINRNNTVLRFYAWLYGASPYEATFCKMFWGLVFVPIALVVRPFGVVSFKAIDRFANWLAERSIAKEDRTGKSFEERHPRIDRWMSNENSSGFSLVPYGIVTLVFVIVYAFTKPIEILWYVPTMTVLGAFIYWLNKKKPKLHGPRFLGTAYHALKSRTCPRIDVVGDDGASIMHRSWDELLAELRQSQESINSKTEWV